MKPNFEDKDPIEVIENINIMLKPVPFHVEEVMGQYQIKRTKTSIVMTHIYPVWACETITDLILKFNDMFQDGINNETKMINYFDK